MVGRAETMRESSEMDCVPGTNGTLKSTLTRHRLPAGSRSERVFHAALIRDES